MVESEKIVTPGEAAAHCRRRAKWREHGLVSSSVSSGPSLLYEIRLQDGERVEIPVRPSVNDIGEGFVLYWLTQRLGFEAELVGAGTPLVDIRVSAPAVFDVQVKTAIRPRWQVGGEMQGVQVAPSLWFVLVEWDRMSETIVRYFVLHSEEVCEIANEQHEEWRSMAGPDAMSRGRWIVERLSASSEPLDLKPFETWDALIKLGTS
jgi:hypothetical protein